MTKAEALELLSNIPEVELKVQLAINRSITVGQGVIILKSAMHAYPDPLPYMIEKRVWQVVRNQRKPKF